MDLAIAAAASGADFYTESSGAGAHQGTGSTMSLTERHHLMAFHTNPVV